MAILIFNRFFSSVAHSISEHFITNTLIHLSGEKALLQRLTAKNKTFALLTIAKSESERKMKSIPFE